MNKDQTKRIPDSELIYQLEGKPTLKTALPLGLQHVLAMFTGNLAPILVIAGAGALSLKADQIVLMVQCAMLVSGLTTLVQLYPIKFKLFGNKFQIGAGMPIVMGTSFAFVPSFRNIGAAYGLPGVLGASLLGGFVEVLMGFFLKPLKKFFPPLVVGSVLVAIGLNLLEVGANYFGGGAPGFNPNFGSAANFAVAFFVFALIIIIQKFGKGMIKVSAVLIGIIIGYIVYYFFVDQTILAGVITAKWISIPLPFGLTNGFSFSEIAKHYSFNGGAILSIAAIYVVSGLETIANTSGIAIAGFNRDATATETSGAILADAFGSQFATIFGTLPNTAFGQNAGIIAMTKIVNKWCIAVGAFVLIGAAFFPKIGAIFAAIPSSVLGGAVISVFAMILINGLKMIAKAGFSDRNITVLGITFAIGLGLGGFPAELRETFPKIIQLVLKDHIALVCVVAILTNFIFPASEEEIKQAQVIEVE